jgi:hypothetical protein
MSKLVPAYEHDGGDYESNDELHVEPRLFTGPLLLSRGAKARPECTPLVVAKGVTGTGSDVLQLAFPSPRNLIEAFRRGLTTKFAD